MHFLSFISGDFNYLWSNVAFDELFMSRMSCCIYCNLSFNWWSTMHLLYLPNISYRLYLSHITLLSLGYLLVRLLRLPRSWSIFSFEGLRFGFSFIRGLVEREPSFEILPYTESNGRFLLDIMSQSHRNNWVPSAVYWNPAWPRMECNMKRDLIQNPGEHNN
jgi:hypothetical protein